MSVEFTIKGNENHCRLNFLFKTVTKKCMCRVLYPRQKASPECFCHGSGELLCRGFPYIISLSESTAKTFMNAWGLPPPRVFITCSMLPRDFLYLVEKTTPAILKQEAGSVYTPTTLLYFRKEFKALAREALARNKPIVWSLDND